MDAHIRVVLDRRRPPGVAPEPPAHRRSVFADRLLQLWGWGLLSANMVQFLAEGVVLDDGVCEETRSLAALGGGRRHPGNCRRDLLRRYCSKGDLVKPMPVPMPVQLHSGIQQGEGYVVSPIDMFEYMFSTFPAASMELLAKNVRKFWDEVNPSGPRLLGHPLLEKGNYREKAVPLVLHGDGAQFARKAQQSLLVCSWRSLLNTAFDFGIFLLFCLPKSIRVKAGGDGPDSARTLWRVVVHLLNALFEGRHPTHDHTGAPWPARSRQAAQAGKDVGAGGFFAVVWNITGDLPFLAEDLGFPHFNSNAPCWLCGCNRSDAPFTDVSSTAAWRSRLVSYIAGATQRLSAHPVWDLVGVTRWCAPGDLMHTGCLGVLSWLLGAVLWELVYEGPFAGTLQQRLDALFAAIQRWYAALGVGERFTHLTLEMFRKEAAFAELSGQAAETRHLLPVLTALCQELGCRSDRDRHRLAALQAISAFYSTIAQASRFPSQAEAAAAADAVETFCLHYHWLARHSVDRGVLCYNFPFKFHALWHIAQSARFQNPTSTWCYAFESFLGQVVRAARACTPGTPMPLVCRKVCENYTLALHLELQRWEASAGKTRAPSRGRSLCQLLVWWFARGGVGRCVVVVVGRSPRSDSLAQDTVAVPSRKGVLEFLDSLFNIFSSMHVFVSCHTCFAYGKSLFLRGCQ